MESNSIVVRRIDDAVWKDVCDTIRNPAKLAEHIEALKTPDPTLKHALPIHARKKAVEEEIESLVDLSRSAKSEIARKKISELLAQSERELEILEAEEKILAGEKELWQEAQKEIDKFYSWCREWQNKLDEATYKDKRVCLEYLGVSVKIFRLGIKPRFTISYAPPNIVRKLRVALPQLCS